MPVDLPARAADVVSHLSRLDAWNASLAGATVDLTPAEVSMLVPLPDEPTAYAIFSVRRGARITGQVILESATARLVEARGVRDTAASLPPFVDPRAISLPVPAVMPAVPSLVWRYCMESTSLFLPFWRIPAGPMTYYVRVDGAIFTSLTDVN